MVRMFPTPPDAVLTHLQMVPGGDGQTVLED